MGKTKTILFSLGLGALAAASYLHFSSKDIEVKNDEGLTYKEVNVFQMEGLASATMLNHHISKDLDYNIDKLTTGSILSGDLIYVDGGSRGKYDGLVDTIEKRSMLEVIMGEAAEQLYREKHFGTHMENFLKADKALADTKERFKEYIDF